MGEDVVKDSDKEIVEKRVRPTVIRRRVKVVEAPTEKVEEEAIAEKAAPAEAKEPQKVAEIPEEPEAKAPVVKGPPGKKSAKEATPATEVAAKPEVPSPKVEAGAAKKRKKVTVKVEAEEKPDRKRVHNPAKGKETFAKRGPRPGGQVPFRRHEKRKKKVSKEGLKKTEITTPKAIKRVIKVSELISVGELAKKMGAKAPEVIKKLIAQGMMATVNQTLDIDTATLIAEEFGYEVENIAIEMDMLLEEKAATEEELRPRPPVVTIMGHVDHGKTTLLDAIRLTDVTAGESGGITQHIGAYDVSLDNGDVVFLDTPGHEAFTAMRARGAKVTDIVVLVVAADDGVKPQTAEAIDHARAADVPIIVAINKIDKPEANPDKVKQELSKYELISEEWGGSTIFANVSAKERTGLKELLEMILLQSEVMELKAAPEKAARGIIVESKLDKGRGPVATVLVQGGTLKIGDNFVAGIHSGKVRGLQNDKGKRVKDAGPSIPVEVTGLSGVPDAGDDFVVVAEERLAKQVSLQRQGMSRDSELAKSSKITLDDLFSKIQEGEVHELNIILKADVQGSIEAITESLHKLSTDQVKLKVIHDGVGGITESDVLLASASNAIIIGFHVRPEIKAAKLAETESVDIRSYSIIYDVVNDVRAAMEGLLSPVIKEVYLGRAEIRETYTISKIGTIAGCYVVDGKILRNADVRVLRENVVIFEGKLNSLKRFKDDVKDVQSGYECGMGVENFNDIKVGDVIEAFTHEEEAAKL